MIKLKENVIVKKKQSLYYNCIDFNKKRKTSTDTLDTKDSTNSTDSNIDDNFIILY